MTFSGRRTAIRLVALLLVLLVLAPAQGENKPRTADDLLGGEKIVATISGAESVRAVRLKDAHLQRSPDDYEAQGKVLELEKDLGRQWARAITAHETYERDVVPGCEPVFGVRLTFTRDKSQVDVVLCYQCDQLVVYHQGKRVGGGYFAPGAAALRGVAKRTFPDDRAIQGLPTE